MNKSMNDPLRLKMIKLRHSIKQRCTNKNGVQYKNYGGKGIKNLLTIEDLIYIYKRDNADQLKRPSIDRIDPAKDYQVYNCRFIELSENIGRQEHKHKRRQTTVGMTKEELKSLRAKANLTQQELATMIGVQLSTLARWEQGNRGVRPSMAKLINHLIN